MRRPELKYELEEEDAVGGRRCPAENGELLRRDDDDDGRDDIARGSRGSFAPREACLPLHSCCCCCCLQHGKGGEGAEREGKVSGGQRLHMACSKRGERPRRRGILKRDGRRWEATLC